MSLPALQETPWISPEEYLEGETVSPIRHEYVGGAVYAMSGGSLVHNVITGNIFAELRQYLRGRPCRVYVNDVKVQARIGLEELFYYPDVVIVCDHSGRSKYVVEHPAIIFEVVSPGTEQIDRREKLLSYKTIPSLEGYVLVEQERVEITLFERATHWHPQTFRSKEDALRLAAVGFELKLERIYEDSGL